MSTNCSSYNKWGGERAICPRCKKLNSEEYEFMKEDFRDLECSECHKDSYFHGYFPKTFKAIFYKEKNEFSDWSPHR